MREADVGGGNTIQGLFSAGLHFIGGYVDVNDRWNKKLLGRLFLIIFSLIYGSIFSIVMLGSFRYGILVLLIYHCLILYTLVSFFLFFLEFDWDMSLTKI